MDCVFCDRILGGDLIASNDLAVAFLDNYPLSKGHSLIVPRRHESDFLALSTDEHAAIWTLVLTVCRHLNANIAPDGFNIGINIGVAAGQTVFHAHVHVIPRRTGDVGDPRGGVRWIIPSRARYWDSE